MNGIKKSIATLIKTIMQTIYANYLINHLLIMQKQKTSIVVLYNLQKTILTRLTQIDFDFTPFFTLIYSSDPIFRVLQLML